MGDLVYVGESERYWYFKSPSERAQPGEMHSVRVNKDTMENDCTCRQFNYVTRKPGPRERAGKKYHVGPPGVCHHRQAALERAKTLREDELIRVRTP